ncbi:MAG: RpiB/LacA/LacB family sugar-phosphate isomerase [Bdellovibrio sp.]|nr:RpiB/LacA/LacB family sugar-phosphate isomerase [Bdellovibrio sp.]
MRIALCSDEPYPIHDLIAAEIQKRRHEVVPFGSLITKKEEPWWIVAKEAALSIYQGQCQEGIFLCWTGTGIAIAANKVSGIRAALCTDPETAAGARTWNHANVLALSNRLLTPELACAILGAWFATPMDARGQVGAFAVDSMGGLKK